MVDIHEQSLASDTYVVGKGRLFLIALLNNFGYSLILYQHLTSGGFLKLQLRLGNCVNVVFLSCYIRINWSVLDLISSLALHNFEMCMHCSFEKTVVFPELCRSFKCWCFSLCSIKKSHSLIWPLSYQREHMVEGSDFIIGNKYHSCKQWVHLLIFEEIFVKCPGLNIQFVSFSFKLKIIFCERNC